MAPLFVGKCFESSDEAEKFVSEFCKHNFHPVRRKHNTTSTYYNKKISEKSKLPDSIKYIQMQWECKHFGVFKSKGNEKKKIQHVLAKGCKFQIGITYNRSLQKFIVTKANLEHLNHEISPEIYAMYPDHRKPNPKRMIEVDNMLKNNVNPMLIANILHSEGSQVRIKDLHNRKRKLIKSQLANEEIKPIDDSLSSVLSQPGIIYQMMSGSDNMFEVLFFQTTKQQKMFSGYKEVVQIDATYKNPDLHYSLYTLLIEDKNGSGQPVAFGILEKPDQTHIEQFLEFFIEQNDVTGIQCFVIDNDQAEINAIRTIFPNTHISIYYFHVLKAVDNYLSSYEDPKIKKTCLNHFNLALKSKTNEEFHDRLKVIKALSTSFHEYIVHNWFPFKQSITNFGDSNLMNLQNPTCSRIKRFHNLLKGVLGSVHLPLNEFLKSLLKIVDDLSLESLHKQFDMNVKTIVIQPNVGEYYNHYTDYAAGLISKEIKKMTSKRYSIYSITNNQWTVTNEKTSYIVEGMKCSCGMPTQMGLPCQHLFAVWNDNGEPFYQPDSVASRWKKENKTSLSNDPSDIMPLYEVEVVTEDSSNIPDGHSYLSHTSGLLIPSCSEMSNGEHLAQSKLIATKIKKEIDTIKTMGLNNFNSSYGGYSQENFQISNISDYSHKLEVVVPVGSTIYNNSKSLYDSSTPSGILSKMKPKKYKVDQIQELDNTLASLKNIATMKENQPTCNYYLIMAAIEKFKTLVASTDPNILNLELQELIDKLEKLKKK